MFEDLYVFFICVVNYLVWELVEVGMDFFVVILVKDGEIVVSLKDKCIIYFDFIVYVELVVISEYC